MPFTRIKVDAEADGRGSHTAEALRNGPYHAPAGRG
jgi:hypothetical protein